MIVRTCGWCGTSNSDPGTNCVNCGGPLPPPPGGDPGPAPPPAPRQFPASYRRRVLVTGNVLTIIGIVFSLLASLGVVGSVAAAIVMRAIAPLAVSAFSLIFGAIGGPMLYFGWKRGTTTLTALERGNSVVGRITDVYMDTNESINNRHPWAIVYAYDVAGRAYEGLARTWDPSVRERAAGQPLHVLYLPQAPDRSTVWPPIR